MDVGRADRIGGRRRPDCAYSPDQHDDREQVLEQAMLHEIPSIENASESQGTIEQCERSQDGPAI
jgi:hypothetical protein